MIIGDNNTEAEKENDDISHLLTSNQTVINIDHPPQKPVAQLNYLKIFSETELEELENNFNRPLYELEKMLADNRIRRWAYRIENVLANSTNLLYIIFLINTSHEGVDDFIHFFYKETLAPGWLGYLIGISFAVLSTLLNMLTFSPEKESYKSTLQSICDKSFKEKTHDVYQNLSTSPRTTLLNGVYGLANSSILITINSTAGMINIIDIADKINTLSKPLRWLIIATILYFSQKDYGNYMNSNYHNGLKFWRDKSLPWLIKEMREGQIAIPLQIIGQSASSIGLRLLIFYYLSLASSKALGSWLPSQMVITLAILHSFCTLYPSTYHFYLDDKLKIKSIYEGNKPCSELTFKKYKREKQELVLRTKGHFYLFKTEPMITLSIALGMAICGWLGWQAGTQVDHSLIAPIMMAIFISIALGSLFYQAEANRVMNQLILTHVNKTDQNEKNQATNGKTCCQYTFDKAASLINIASSGSVIMSNVGIIGRLFYDSSDSIFFTPISIFLAFLRGLNMLRFNSPKIHNTMKSLVPERFCSRMQEKCRFFATQPVNNTVIISDKIESPKNNNQGMLRTVR